MVYWVDVEISGHRKLNYPVEVRSDKFLLEFFTPLMNGWFAFDYMVRGGELFSNLHE